jgi:hypothetical protein
MPRVLSSNLAAQRPWRGVTAPPEVAAVPSMLSAEERALLYWLARDYWSGVGRIIDAGCFLGGSTVALATGLRDHRDTTLKQPIVVFDRFVVEQYALDGGFFADAPELQAGDDFRPLFERYLAGLEELLDVRAGDILQQAWGGEPIEILFLDVLKTWELNDAIVREFWPALIPEQAIVVQQDYQYSCVPWLAITMEQLGECFERLDELPWSTVVYRLLRPLPDLRTIPLSRDLPPERQLALMDRAVARETTPTGEAMLRLSRALLLYLLERSPAAHAELTAVRRTYGDDGGVAQAADRTEDWFHVVDTYPTLRPSHSAPGEAEQVPAPWRKVEISDDIRAVPSMVSNEERALLYWLARDYWSGAGRIIDAGCFLGGSTIALATGLRDRRDSAVPPPITVFDRFVVEQYALAGGFFADASDLRVGDDFRPLFDRYLAGLEEFLDVRGGDILQQRWSRESIEILFLDLLKTWEVNDAVVREFWPSLIPEQAIVVQQDYQYAGYPWLAITMELFAGCFERLDDIGYGTVVFRLIEPLPDLRGTPLSRELPRTEKLALMDRALARETTPTGEAMLRLSRALLLHYLGHVRRARAEVAGVQRAYGADASVAQALATTRGTLGSFGAQREMLRHAPGPRFLRMLAG